MYIININYNCYQRRFEQLHFTGADKFKPPTYPKKIVLWFSTIITYLLLFNSIKFHFTKLLSTDPLTTHPPTPNFFTGAPPR